MTYVTETVIIFCTKMWYIAEKRIKEGRFLKTFKLQISNKKSQLLLPLLREIFSKL